MQRDLLSGGGVSAGWGGRLGSKSPEKHFILCKIQPFVCGALFDPSYKDKSGVQRDVVACC